MVLNLDVLFGEMRQSKLTFIVLKNITRDFVGMRHLFAADRSGIKTQSFCQLTVLSSRILLDKRIEPTATR